MQYDELKSKIFIMRIVDWVLFLTVAAIGAYAVLYSDNPKVPGIIAIVGLLVVGKIGDVLRSKIARMQVEMNKIEKEVARNFGKLR